MSLIAHVDYSTALNYKGLSLSTKYNGKKHKVYLKLICDDFTLKESIELAKGSKNILMLEYQGLDTNPVYSNLGNTGVYIGRVIEFGNNLTEDDLTRIVNDTPEGVTPIVRLPDDFKDLRFLWDMTKKFGKVRFCGGTLFSIKGVNVGAIGVDILDAHEIKYEPSSFMVIGTDDVIESVGIDELEITTSSKSESKGSSKPKKSSSGKKKSPTKPQVTFSSMLLKNGLSMP